MFRKKPVDPLETFEVEVEIASTFIDDLKTKATGDLDKAQDLLDEIEKREERYSTLKKRVSETIGSLEKFLEILGKKKDLGSKS